MWTHTGNGAGISRLFQALVVTFLCCSSSAWAIADTGPVPEHATSGTLFLHTLTGEGDTRRRSAPRLHTEVHYRINGLLARAEVTQRFRNPGQDWAEGVYVFPLPENAAVDSLRMRIGERLIVGEIQERHQARRSYQQARVEGRKAALVEQQRPNIFTTSVANIPPAGIIEISIGYQHTLALRHGGFALRFPLVVAPRYIPGSPSIESFSGDGWARDTDQVPDASRITPPVQVPGKESPRPVKIRVDLQAGFKLDELESPFHAIRKQPLGEAEGEGWRISLAEGDIPADRDFVLRWRPSPDTLPRAALYKEHRDGQDYALLMLMPPQGKELPAATALPRESIFVIDTSGSMHGESLRQARAALHVALDRLGPADRFNIIQFNARTHGLFSRARPASRENLALGRRYLDGLRADGGTEMAPALMRALIGSREYAGASHLRQVLFLTDGAVGNEQALFRLIRKRLGSSRLFPVGIGSAPNSHFMSRAAHFGRGTYTYIGSTGEVQQRMQELLEQLSRPVLRDLRLEPPAGQSWEYWPAPLPDLYADEPLMVALRGDRLEGKLRVSGRLAGQDWSSELNIQGGMRKPGIHRLWARKRITSLDDEAELTAEQRKKAITEIALAHQLVSRHTSLVAVDRTPSRPADETLRRNALATRLPAGWSHAKVFGSLPQTATGVDGLLRNGLLWLLLGALLMAWTRRNRGRR